MTRFTMMADLHFSTLTELAAAIASREISPVAVVERMLERIRRFDDWLRSYVTVTGELARRQAERAEAVLASGGAVGPLHGVPIAVKDLCDTRDVETARGMTIFAGRVPVESATAVERLLDAGAVLLGKVKTTEGAGSVHHPSIPAPINPWNGDRWCGASSSGSGVAVAAGLCFGAIGTDTAGSIRFPSASNGIVGLKPTFGRVPAGGVFPLAPSLDHVGPMTRSVRDAARMLGVMADSTSAAGQDREDFEATLDAGAAGMRIGIDEDYCSRNVDSTLSEAVLRAARHLASIGAELRPIRIDGIDEALEAFAVTMHSEIAAVHAPYFSKHRAEYGPNLGGVIEIGERMSDSDRARADEIRARFRNRLTEVLGTVDAMICPPAMTPPPPLAFMQYVPDDFRQMAMALRYTAPYTFTGVPTLTVPCGFAEDDVPLALQLVAAPFQEGRLLRIGQAYEQSTDWHRRHPAL